MKQSPAAAIARPATPYVRATWHQPPPGPGLCQVVVGKGERAVVVRNHVVEQVLEASSAVALSGQGVWWFRTEPTSVRVAIDWQGGRERHRYALGLEITFVIADPDGLATWLLDQQEPDDIVETLVARAVSRRVSWLLAELGPVRSELQRIVVSEIRTNAIRPICPGVAIRQVIVSQCERQDARAATAAANASPDGRPGDTPPVTAATAAHRPDDLVNTEEIDVSAVMADAMSASSESSAEIVLFSSDMLPVVRAGTDFGDITRPAIKKARQVSTTEDDSEPYADIEVGAPHHPQFPLGTRVLVADHRGRWQTAVVTRSGPDLLEVQVEHTGMIMSVSPSAVLPP